jgi:hypothetical protein
MEMATFSKFLSVLGLLTSNFFSALQPFYLRDNVASAPALEGTFLPARPADASGKTWEAWIYKPGASAGDCGKLRLVIESQSNDFVACPFRLILNDRAAQFLDIVPDTSYAGGGYFQRHVLLAHSVIQVDATADELHIAVMDRAELEKKASGTNLAARQTARWDQLVLTAPTEELQKLLLQSPFTAPVTMYRQRAAPKRGG